MQENRIPRRTLAALVLGTAAVSGGLAAAMVLLFKTTDRDPKEVLGAAEKVLQQRFPQTQIRFSPMAGSRVEQRGDGKYQVTGWMEVTTQEGEAARLDYSCTMIVVPGEHWVAENVELVPRP